MFLAPCCLMTLLSKPTDDSLRLPRLPFPISAPLCPSQPGALEMSLPLVLDWIEAHVRPEHKMRVARYAMHHSADLIAIIQSAFDQKEDLMLQMVGSSP